jgi:CubicO group peptidase (beta-lactamase class C family)
MPISLGTIDLWRLRRSARVGIAISALALISLPACGVTAQRATATADRVDLGTIARGDVTRLTDSLGIILENAVRDSAFPGAIAVVGTRDGVLVERVAGHLDWAPSPAPDAATLWDLASLTKVVALTSAMMKLVEQRRVDLDAPVQRYLPDWTGPNKELVTVRHLLTHSSGLPAWRPLYKEAASPQGAVSLALATPLDTLPGLRMVYSDLGAIILGQIVQRVSGVPFERFVHEQIFAPAKMTETRFLPPESWKARIAPTEIDPWRGRHLRGEVHDENAFALGGVSSHAGLFSTARDLGRFARMYLNWGTIDGVRIFDSTTVATFTRMQNPALSHRALGWETPNGSNSGGTRMSCAAFGHTGFTGTSIWMDPVRNLFVLLLTNRVNPTRERRAISSVRVVVADAAQGLWTTGLAASETSGSRQSSETRSDRSAASGVRGCQS